jgi:acetolactate synthase-1/2/3 large subunit
MQQPLSMRQPCCVRVDVREFCCQGLLCTGRDWRQLGAIGVKLFAPYPIMRIERGVDLEQALEQLREFRQLILVDAPVPVTYFAYPGKSSVLTQPECENHTLASEDEDGVTALEELAALVPPLPPSASPNSGVGAQRPPVPSGEVTLPGVAAVGALLAEERAGQP